MFCNWTITYEPATVTIDPERGPEPGASFVVTSDWDDEFSVHAVPHFGYNFLREWARATDDGVVPDYFCDFLVDLVSAAVNGNGSGTSNYQVDLSPDRVGTETARERWASETA